MEQSPTQASTKRPQNIIKALILVAFIIGAVFLVRYTPIKNYLTAEALGVFLDAAGF